jgi:para-aminobenzoate synthetase/4-amino-4-deoxychorismate lyase
LGWIAPDGDFRFNVPIRTLEVDRDQNVKMGLGSGIVTDSVPPEEWIECLLKGRFLSSLAPEFGLIETLRCEPGGDSALPLLDRHLERLADSASHFGIPVDLGAVRLALVDTAVGLTTLHRVRLLLGGNGEFTIAITPHADFPQDERPTIVISPTSVMSTNKLIRHKTTVRNRYDRELSRVTADGHFDALFFNERGELAEGARSNIFLDLGQAQLVTPPITSGALNGVLRKKLLDEGRAREMVLDASHLAKARAIYAANALRGLFRVTLVGTQG